MDIDTQNPKALALIECLSCPICFEIFLPPIQLCVNGHCICSNCRTRVNNKCPMCRGAYSPVRNLFTQNIIEVYLEKFACRFKDQGCPSQLMTKSECDNHVKSCEYKNFLCKIKNSVGTCDGKSIEFGQFEYHMHTVHRLRRVRVCYGTVPFEISSTLQNMEDLMQERNCDPWLIPCNNKLFIAMRKYTSTEVCFWVVGNITSQEAKTYNASIYITNSKKSKKYLWGGAVHSIHEDFGVENRPQHGCLILSKKMYLGLADRDESNNTLSFKHVFKVSPNVNK